MELDEQEKLLNQLEPERIKRKKKKHVKPIPRKKWCQCCMKRRVKFHHYYCESCWKKEHGLEKEEEDNVEF